jgi:hypothetical protein
MRTLLLRIGCLLGINARSRNTSTTARRAQLRIETLPPRVMLNRLADLLDLASKPLRECADNAEVAGKFIELASGQTDEVPVQPEADDAWLAGEACQGDMCPGMVAPQTAAIDLSIAWPNWEGPKVV